MPLLEGPDTPDDSGNPLPMTTTETVTFRDGRIYTWTYEDGILVSRTITDPENAKNYASVRTDYAPDGTVIRRTEEPDDGIIVEEEFTDGVRTREIRIGTGGVEPWLSRETTFDLTGETTSLTVRLDNGETQIQSFNGGILTSYQTFGGPDGDVLRLFDAATGDLISVSETGVDGIIDTRAYVIGVLASVNREDALDVARLTSVREVYDLAGFLTARTLTNDNGTVRADTFNAGTLAQRVVTDMADVNGWETVIVTYDAAGDLIGTRTTFDDMSVEADGSFLV